MCGIFGYVGYRAAIPLVMEGLHFLEYRGYDSAGIVFEDRGELLVIKSLGKVSLLDEKLNKYPSFLANTALGHTRWATHGVPSENNAHPHKSNSSKLAIVHNGIIENYQELKEELLKAGYIFFSETDTEILVNYIEYRMMQENLSLQEALKKVLRRLCGTYAFAIMSIDEPRTIYAARVGAPLTMGIGIKEYFLASDVSAFLQYTKDVIFIEEGELLCIKEQEYTVIDLKTDNMLNKTVEHISWDIQSAKKGGFKHYMLKEIYEQPHVIKECCTGRVFENIITIPEIEDTALPESIYIIACGTSYYAALWAKYILEDIAGIHTEVEVASEFRYRKRAVGTSTTVIAISQSGETADTLAALRIAKEENLYTIALCNVIGSSLAREADTVIYTQAGPEISVASTKAMMSQMLVIFLMSLVWAKKKGAIEKNILEKYIEEIKRMPSLLESALESMQRRSEELAMQFAHVKSFFYLGRDIAYPLVLEGALKLKELSYIHAEGYPAGEMKHGPIALIDSALPTLVLLFDDMLISKMKATVEEIQARRGSVIAIVPDSITIEAEHLWYIPEAFGVMQSFIALPAMQLLSYSMAVYLGHDVDQPRNLAKSVTVE
ncbi:MAG: glutamine--fructose-6-phosphate transaminase (isomerizing) [Desulfovibrionaceae bacterium]